MRLIDADAFYKDICDSLNEMTRIGITVDGEWLWGKLNDSLENAPTIDSDPHWTPCSERPPRTNGVYNVTRKISDGFECGNISDSCYYDGAYTWHDDTRVNHERRYLRDVIAWMPLPEPYEGGEG